MNFYMVYTHPTITTATDCSVLDIIISDYYVILTRNLEHFANKVSFLLTHSFTHSLTLLLTY